MKQTLFAALVAVMFTLVCGAMAQANDTIALPGVGQPYQVAQSPAPAPVALDGNLASPEPAGAADINLTPAPEPVIVPPADESEPAPDNSRDRIEKAAKVVTNGGYIPHVETNRVRAQSLWVEGHEIIVAKDGSVTTLGHHAPRKDAGGLAGFTAKIGELNDAIFGVKKVNETTKTDLNTKIGGVEQSLAGLKGIVAGLNADVSALNVMVFGNKKVQGLGARMDKAEGNINQLTERVNGAIAIAWIALILGLCLCIWALFFRRRVVGVEDDLSDLECKLEKKFRKIEAELGLPAGTLAPAISTPPPAPATPPAAPPAPPAEEPVVATDEEVAAAAMADVV